MATDARGGGEARRGQRLDGTVSVLAPAPVWPRAESPCAISACGGLGDRSRSKPSGGGGRTLRSQGRFPMKPPTDTTGQTSTTRRDVLLRRSEVVRSGLLKLLAVKDSDIRQLIFEQCR